MHVGQPPLQLKNSTIKNDFYLLVFQTQNEQFTKVLDLALNF